MASLAVRWPIRLRDSELELRPLRLRDAGPWRSIRSANVDWLREWDATLPAPDPSTPTSFAGMVRQANREARAGRALPFGMFVRGSLAGQVTVGGISWGSLRSAYVGYWIGREYAGQGLTPRAVAMAGDHAFFGLELHRLEINIRPENAASLAVVRKLGFRNEGIRERYLHINGKWADHYSFALTSDERPSGLQAWLRARATAPETGDSPAV